MKLLHTIVTLSVSPQFPDIHDFMDDVLHVPLAAKVGLGDLKTDVNDFQSSFRALVKVGVIINVGVEYCLYF